MAVRNFWTIKDGKVAKGKIEFKWESGLSTKQKQRSMLNMHAALNYRHDLFSALDISSASDNPIGVALSAFNLKWKGTTIECWYQGSKVYSVGGAQHHLYSVDSLTAKKSMKDNLGNLIGFNLNGVEFPMFPKTVFYDWIYLQGMYDTYYKNADVCRYKVFTDIQATEDIDACQARAVCEYKLLCITDRFDVLEDFDKFTEWHKQCVEITYVPEVIYNGDYRYIPERDSFKILSRDLGDYNKVACLLSVKFKQNEFGEYYRDRSDLAIRPEVVVYSDLLLDDLCALEQLYKNYGSMHIVCVNFGDLKNSDYGYNYDVFEITERIKADAANNGCIVTFNVESDGFREMLPYLVTNDIMFDIIGLSNATALVKDLPYIEKHIKHLSAMIGKSENDTGKDEWNAAQDIESYIQLRQFIKENGYNLITADKCEQLFNENKYWNVQSNWLNIYIDKMNTINDSIVCFDLQCVMHHLQTIAT